MKKFTELRPTKKYAEGTVHEMASGEFQITERWLGDDGFVMLKYVFLEDGREETNREVNVASALAKFKKKKEQEASRVSPDQLEEVRKELNSIQEQLRLLAIQQATILQKLEKIESR